MYISFAEEYEEKKIQDLGTLKSDGTSNDNNCWDRCNDNRLCGGFYVFNTTCHFLNGNDVKSAGCHDRYVKNGIISKNNIHIKNLKLIFVLIKGFSVYQQQITVSSFISQGISDMSLRNE